jgi:pimeloyl-[acyl-carrier protein] methyl ester esterase
MTSGIITFAAIPKFIKNDDWPVGVSHGAFSTLKQTFSRQPKIALKRFIMLQNQNMHFTNSKNITKLLAYIETAPLEIILRDLELLEHTDLRSVVSALTIPQLNILADNDRLVPSSIDDELKRLSPQSHNVIIKNAGHAMLISHTDECLTIIENFINESIITQ